ncbi:MAG: phenylalanine--tRNA ligase subunit beta [bacterium]|nr:phenylalanine--tRNA ligase subunit beta [bacterium]
MKFSYTLLKKLTKAVKNPEQLAKALTFHAFEVEGIEEDVVSVAIPANRYSDSASHWGLARIITAIAGRKWIEPKLKSLPRKPKSKQFSIKVSDKDVCPRYSALYVEVPKIGDSPQWLQDALIACGLKPINNVVDVMNYVMLEVGQPLHAFDADLVEGPIEVRLAKRKERIITIDDQNTSLDPSHLVIADNKGPLAIAGVKGGKRAAVNRHTRKLIIESASFDATSIYKTLRAVNLLTDASLRFSHGLSPVLTEKAIKRAAALLKEVCKAKVGDYLDINYTKHSHNIIKFDLDRFNSLTGLSLNLPTCFKYLKNLGFAISGKMVKVPEERTDITIFEDLVEEIVNIYGYDKLPSIIPHVALASSGQEDQLALKDQVRSVLTGLGMSEVYNYSFVKRSDALADAKIMGGKPVALRNPISADFQYLRPSLRSGLAENLKGNLRFYDEVRVFEVGKIFPNDNWEVLSLGIALERKNGKADDSFLELKGIMDNLLKKIGVVDFTAVPYLDGLRIESGHQVIGFLLGRIIELDLNKLATLISGEKEYLPLSKYPTVMRDLSFLVDRSVRVYEIQNLMENDSHLLQDVDLLDWYEDDKLGAERKSLTFRFIFQANDRTLTDEEVGREMEKIVADLQAKFDIDLR